MDPANRHLSKEEITGSMDTSLTQLIWAIPPSDLEFGLLEDNPALKTMPLIAASAQSAKR
jgi:hypothetical protein